MKRKIFSAVLALAMVLALLPTALAAWSSPYEDIDGSEWFGDEAVFVTDRGLMKGSAAGTFDPDGSITRGQLVTILYRMAGKPDASASAFTDVADGKYYSKAAAWAAASGIAAGYPDGTFRPEAVLTREQTAQILYAYSGYAGYDVTASGDLSAYPDAGSVGSDAAAAMGWAVAKKLIDGVDGKLLPQTGVTRAQTAVILTRFCKNVVPAVTTERFDDTYYLFQLPTGIRMEGYDGVCVWDTSDTIRNSWLVVPAGDGYFRIVSGESSQVLVPRESAEGAQIVPTGDGGGEQLWKLVQDGESVHIVHVESGLAMGTQTETPGSGEHLYLERYAAGDASQMWTITSKEETPAALSAMDLPLTIPDVHASVASVRLIEEDYIEIMWDNKVSGSTDPANYKVTINGETVEIDPYRSFYYQGMTSLGLVEPLEDPEAATGTITVSSNIVSSTGTPVEEKTYEFKYDPYYTQFVTSEAGVLIKSNDKVQMSTLELTAKTVDFMLSRLPDVAAEMKKNGMNIAIYGGDENAYYIPEYRSSTDPTVNPALGLGGEVNCNFAESAILDGWENVLTHEFGHAIKYNLYNVEDKSLIREYEDAFINAKLTNRWPDTYAISNAEEFFACMTSIWFDVSSEAESGGSVGPYNMQYELKIYDPQTYAFFEKLYVNEHLPEGTWDYEASYVDDYKMTEAPDITEYQPPVDPDENTPAEDYDLSRDYFKIYSFLGTNGITFDYSEPPMTTWWDYSNSDYNYNFDDLSWKVEKVGDYYRFSPKTDPTLALMPVGSGTTLGTELTTGPIDENDDSQLWELVMVKGYFCQLVNKASGLALGTRENELPADGTVLELVEYVADPDMTPYSQQWRVIRLKDNPGDENLTADSYCIRPVKK